MAMSQWEDKAVVTVRATVLTAGTMRVLVNGKPVSPAGFTLAACAGAHSALVFLSGDLRVAAGEPAAALLEVSACDIPSDVHPTGWAFVSASCMWLRAIRLPRCWL